MYFSATTLCLSSLLLATVSASASVSFELPSGVTSELPGVETTTVYETSTLYFTSPITLTSAPSSTITVSISSAPAYSAPPELTDHDSESCIPTSPPTDTTPTPPISSETIPLSRSGTKTPLPTTLSAGSTARILSPYNSTAIPTGYPIPPAPLNQTSTLTITSSPVGSNSTTAVGTGPSTSTVLITTSVSRNATTTMDESSAAASVSEVPTSGARKGVGNAVLGMGVVAGVMALL